MKLQCSFKVCIRIRVARIPDMNSDYICRNVVVGGRRFRSRILRQSHQVLSPAMVSAGRKHGNGQVRPPFDRDVDTRLGLWMRGYGAKVWDFLLPTHQ